MVLIPGISGLITVITAILIVVPVTAPPPPPNPRPGPLPEDTTHPGLPLEDTNDNPSKPNLLQRKPKPVCSSDTSPSLLTEKICALESHSTGWRLYHEVNDWLISKSGSVKKTYARFRNLRSKLALSSYQVPKKNAVENGPMGWCYCTGGCTGLTPGPAITNQKGPGAT